MSFEVFLILFLVSLPVVAFFQMRKNRKDETKERNYFVYFWVEQRMIGKEEYRNEVILGTILLFLSLVFLAYAVPVLLSEQGGISDPKHPLVFYFGCFAIVSGVSYIIRGFLVRKRVRAANQSVESDSDATPAAYVSTMIYSILFGMFCAAFGALIIQDNLYG